MLDWLGFLFIWEDIISTKNSIVSLVNSTLSFGATAVSGLTPNVEDFFNFIEQQIKDAVYPDEVTKSVGGLKSASTASEPNAVATAHTKTAPANFAQYQWG